MKVYNVWLYFVMRVLGQVTPVELRLLGSRFSSNKIFFTQNLLIFSTVGFFLAYKWVSPIQNPLGGSKGKIAHTIISDLSTATASFSFAFLLSRNVILFKSHSKFKEIYGLLPADEGSDKGLQITSTSLVILLVSNSLANRITAENRLDLHSDQLLYYSELISPVSKIYTLIFAMKLFYLFKVLRRRFLGVNRVLVKVLEQLPPNCCLCTGQDFSLFRLHFTIHTFVDEMNSRFGAELLVIIFHMYIAILYNMYDLAIASALFRSGDPDVWSALALFCNAAQYLVVAALIFGQSSHVTQEADISLEMAWDATPKITCVRCTTTFQEFAWYLKHVPNQLTAKGVFMMNMRTFSKVVSSVTTQLLILISLGWESPRRTSNLKDDILQFWIDRFGGDKAETNAV